MTLTELRYIVAVAQERSFGRAAGKCFVSQPALSVAIQKLEEELGALPADDRAVFAREMGIDRTGLDRLIEAAGLPERARERALDTPGYLRVMGASFSRGRIGYTECLGIPTLRANRAPLSRCLWA